MAFERVLLLSNIVCQRNLRRTASRRVTPQTRHNKTWSQCRTKARMLLIGMYSNYVPEYDLTQIARQAPRSLAG